LYVLYHILYYALGEWLRAVAVRSQCRLRELRVGWTLVVVVMAAAVAGVAEASEVTAG
jgi:hypothetical protein